MRTARLLLKQVRAALLTAFLFGATINLLMLSTPLYTLQVFESVVPLGSVETLIIITAITGCAIVAMSLIEMARDTILLRAALWLDHYLGTFILDNGLRVGGPPAELKRDFRALETVRGFLSSSAVIPLLDGPWVPIFLVALFLLHPAIGVLGLVCAVLLLAMALLQLAMTESVQSEVQDARERSSQWFATMVTSGSLVSSLGLTKGAAERWEAANRSHIASSYSMGKRTSFIKALGRMIRIGSQIAVYGLGAWLVVNDQVTPGTLVASAILLARALGPIEQLGGAIKPAIAALRAYRRLKALPEDYPQAPVANEQATPNAKLQLADVSVYLPGRKVAALRGISLDVGPGECLAIIGPNGAGKSTLAAVMAGAIAPTAGSADLDGLPISRWQRGESIPCIGYLPDEPQLLEGTVHENIVRFTRSSLMTAAAASLAAGVHERLQALPLGYEMSIGNGGTGLSFSERRAVALARACFGRPVALVLDEPECGLDAPTIRSVARALQALKQKGVALVLVTQDSRLLKLADRTVLLANGSISRIGTLNEVMQPVALPHAPPRVERKATSGVANATVDERCATIEPFRSQPAGSMPSEAGSETKGVA